ncbi:hypothetical protein [Chitiniphilus eburneus]|uniref:hypothetical protein n=1 Tax=Chitiniphilus eburneus TaxID=2571148 RepID=UPI00145D5AAD|nr:hypothetical protein [Chitiniphilus eburneus]
MMLARTLLLSNRQLATCDRPWRRIGIANAPALDELTQRLARAGKPLRILIDMDDEVLMAEALPPLGPRDRRALMARRLAQAWPDTPHRHASMTRDNGTAHALYSALPDPLVLDRVLDALAAAGATVLGAWSLSRLALDLSPAGQAYRLLVWPGAEGHLRHGLFTGGRLQRCRLTPSAAGSPDTAPELARHIGQEALLTTRQLTGPGGATAPLEVQVLAPQHVAQGVVAKLQAQAIDGVNAIALPLPSGHTLASYLAMRLHHDAPPSHYGTPRQLRHGRLRRLAWLACVLGVGLLLAALAYASHAQYAAERLDIDTAYQLEDNKQTQRWLARQHPTAATRAALAEPGLAAIRQLDKRHLAAWPDPLSDMQRVGLALLAHPQLMLSRYRWDYRPDRAATAIELAGWMTDNDATTPGRLATSLEAALGTTVHLESLTGRHASIRLRLDLPLGARP